MPEELLRAHQWLQANGADSIYFESASWLATAIVGVWLFSQGVHRGWRALCWTWNAVRPQPSQLYTAIMDHMDAGVWRDEEGKIRCRLLRVHPETKAAYSVIETRKSLEDAWENCGDLLTIKERTMIMGRASHEIANHDRRVRNARGASLAKAITGGS